MSIAATFYESPRWLCVMMVLPPRCDKGIPPRGSVRPFDSRQMN